MTKQEKISDILCDLHDIRKMARQEGFGKLLKDNDGTETTIMDCIENCIDHVEEMGMEHHEKF